MDLRKKHLNPHIVSGAAGTTTGLLAPKRIYVVGGYNGWELHGSNLTQIYDPEKDEWTHGTPMPTHRYSMGMAVVNDKMYVIGGSTGNGILGDQVTRLAINERYTPVDYIPEFQSWVILPLLLAATLLIILCKRRLH